MSRELGGPQRSRAAPTWWLTLCQLADMLASSGTCDTGLLVTVLPREHTQAAPGGNSTPAVQRRQVTPGSRTSGDLQS